MFLNQKLFTLLFSIALLLTACNSDKPKSDDHKDHPAKTTATTTNSKVMKSINGYFGKNTIEFKEDVALMVITTAEEFDSKFGAAKTMKNEIPIIDFSSDNVIAIVTKPSKSSPSIVVNKTETKGNTIHVDYRVEMGAEQSFSSNDLKLFNVPKSIKSVDFTSGSKSKTIAVQ